MEEKQNWKQEAKDWWNDNKRVIKAGVTCGLLGLMYGFIKGGLTVADMRLECAKTRADDDDFVYDETTVDDPELLELIRVENENS